MSCTITMSTLSRTPCTSMSSSSWVGTTSTTSRDGLCCLTTKEFRLYRKKWHRPELLREQSRWLLMKLYLQNTNLLHVQSWFKIQGPNERTASFEKLQEREKFHVALVFDIITFPKHATFYLPTSSRWQSCLAPQYACLPLA